MSNDEPAIVSIQRHPGVVPGRSSGSAYGNVVVVGATDEAKQSRPADQIRASLGKIDRVLKHLGTRRENILSATMYLAREEFRPVLNEVWTAWVGPEPSHWPQRACLVTDLSPGTLFEITVVAARAEDINGA